MNAATKNDNLEKDEKANLKSVNFLVEAKWFHRVKANATFDQLQHLLVDCCCRLNALNKLNCVAELAPQKSSSSSMAKLSTEKFVLHSRLDQDSLSAVVTLSGERVVQAEVSLKYAKSASGFYRATAQPEFHWKMQQLMDAANSTVRALHTLCQARKKYNECVQKGCGAAAAAVSETDLHQFIFSVFNAIKADIKRGRLALTLPKKKSLVELCNFHPIKSFVPPLPHDILLSFYISSAKIVCAAYQVASAQAGTAPNGARRGMPTTVSATTMAQQQTVTIFQAECLVPRLVEIVHLLGTAFAIVHDFTANFGLAIAHDGDTTQFDY
ncbi:hypothetical protein niasHS_016867 [Heterodera schachtii]|uniref:Uncharacterized protein n=1 Tax=Heterodera schachtii TaxID=97005 RepID=A0ABD2IAI0_HETSC